MGPPGDDGDRAPPIVAIVGVSSRSKRFADRGPTRRPIDRARSQLPRPSHARGDPRHARPRAAGSSPPILARHLRNGIEESVHRGDIVEADVDGRVLRQLGDPDRLVTLRSTVKPFGLLALIEAGGIAAFDLEPAELAILASSHSGEDLHVRTLQAIYRRSGVSQALLACGSEGAPLDALTAARLARDGEKAGPVRHMCSGQHTVSLLLSRLHGWDPTDYWKPSHPSQVAYRAAVATAYGTTPAKLRTAIDGCGVETYAFPLREIARAYAMLADPTAIRPDDPRAELAASLDDRPRRDAGQPGDDRRAPRSARHLADEGRARPSRQQGRHGGAARPRDPARAAQRDERGGAVRDGDQDRGRRRLRPGDVGRRRSRRCARRACSTAARCASSRATTGRLILDPHGRLGAETVPEFELAPVGELIG